MDFVSLCRAVARESGAVADGLPLTVVNQKGFLGRVVAWTADAWLEIQTERSDWLFMRAETVFPTVAGVERYPPLPSDFGTWHLPGGFWLHDPAIGLADEGPIRVVDWQTWRWRWGRGERILNRPVEVAVAPGDHALVFGPVPDRTYHVRAEYQRRPQLLVNDTDVPQGLPEHLHPVIVWRALHKYAAYDEATTQLVAALARHRVFWENLIATQLPPVRTISCGGLVLP
jgi:hypothetical protein